MALSTIILGRSRSASRFINRIYGNLILPSASVPAFRQFSSSSSKDNESLVNDAKRPHESLVNNLISQFQSLERNIELVLRNSYSQPQESLAQGQGVEESESVHKGIDDDSFDSFLKDIAIESSNDQVEDCESDKSDDDSKDQGKGSNSDDSNNNSSSDESLSEADDKNENSDHESLSENGETDRNNNSSDESLSEADDKNENSDHESLSENGETVPERDENSETLPKPDDESLPKRKENEQLLKGIEAEILRAKTFMELSAPAAVIPKDFPFKIGNRYYSGNILMTQEYEGELVTVYVESPTIFMNRQCNDYNEKKSSSFSMDLTVLVSDLTKSKKVELKCGARPEGISVYSASDPAEAGHEVRMSDVNVNLKEEFGKYLEARGITLSTTKFIYGYMLDKANKERLRILENIQKMVSA